MSRSIDPEQMKADARVIKDVLLDRASDVLDRAGELADQGVDWAAPHVQTAREKAAPVLAEAAERAAEAAERAKPALQTAADRAKPVIEDVQHRVTTDYLPRVNRAVQDAQTAAGIDGDLAERARAVRAASAAALTTPTASFKARRGHRVAKTVGLTALGAGVAGVGWILWKRSQPIEDPWAEEYWADLEAQSTDTFGDTPVEPAEGMTPPDIAQGAAANAAAGEHGVQPDGKKVDPIPALDPDTEENPDDKEDSTREVKKH